MESRRKLNLLFFGYLFHKLFASFTRHLNCSTSISTIFSRRSYVDMHPELEEEVVKQSQIKKKS